MQLHINLFDIYFQKQPRAVFCYKSCSLKFRKIHRKILVRVSFLACNFIKKATLAQVLSSEFCEISKNTFFIEHLWWRLPLFFPIITTEVKNIFDQRNCDKRAKTNKTRK